MPNCGALSVPALVAAAIASVTSLSDFFRSQLGFHVAPRRENLVVAADEPVLRLRLALDLVRALTQHLAGARRLVVGDDRRAGLEILGQRLEGFGDAGIGGLRARRRRGERHHEQCGDGDMENLHAEPPGKSVTCIALRGARRQELRGRIQAAARSV